MDRNFNATVIVFALAGGLLGSPLSAGDWTRFRGPNGIGIAADNQSPPDEWSESRNLAWKLKLPGPGLSSPIVVGDKVFVTCWSGYAVGDGPLGDQKNLKRHLVCLDRRTGDVAWTSDVDPVLPEEPFRGMFAENGYASHTPVSDGERVYAFFGKSGIHAYDLDGNKLWHKSAGVEDDARAWGSASSPILYKDLVIVPATTESKALIAFDKQSGEQVWRSEADGFASTWGSPVLVELPDGRTDLVISVPFEIWGFNPDTGKLRWFCESIDSDSICSSVVAHDDVVYAIDGMSGSSIAVRAGGEDDVTKTHVLWTGRDRSRIGTPVYYDGRIYWVNRGIAQCVDAATGEQVYQQRVDRGGAAAAPNGREDRGERANRVGGPAGGNPAGGGRFGGGGRGGFGGGMGGQDYSSPVVAGDRMYYTFRSGETVVIKLGPKFEQLATNRFESDSGEFNATPAIADGQLFLRSTTHLYCVAEKSE